ncbi:MAG TPA: hypothetical protein EYN91_02610 [Candidatus Melainabacteria bacterium]|jgi:hypothetical protein|nr:hypothetical protein [Candidatus Melainabacteria bacterium]HIN67149.1 hypothetical protein [Candidatus Obscuribacterales bacterium]
MVSLKPARKRHREGQGLVEVVGVLICVVPAVLLVIDLGMIAIGAGLNDQACRDAARAAASGPPSDLTKGENRQVGAGTAPYDRAEAVVKKIYSTRLPMKVREKIETVETVRDIPTDIGGAVDGEISVKTTIDIFPPFLAGAIVGNQGYTLNSTHTVPITYVVPNKNP